MLFVKAPHAFWDELNPIWLPYRGGDNRIVNPYVAKLDELQLWMAGYGLQYVRNGSHLESLEPGQWCIKSYDSGGSYIQDMNRLAMSREPAREAWDHRKVCFHEADRMVAIVFKITQL